MHAAGSAAGSAAAPDLDPLLALSCLDIRVVVVDLHTYMYVGHATKHRTRCSGLGRAACC